MPPVGSSRGPDLGCPPGPGHSGDMCVAGVVASSPPEDPPMGAAADAGALASRAAPGRPEDPITGSAAAAGAEAMAAAASSPHDHPQPSWARDWEGPEEAGGTSSSHRHPDCLGRAAQHWQQDSGRKRSQSPCSTFDEQQRRRGRSVSQHLHQRVRGSIESGTSLQATAFAQRSTPTAPSLSSTWHPQAGVACKPKAGSVGLAESLREDAVPDSCSAGQREGVKGQTKSHSCLVCKSPPLSKVRAEPTSGDDADQSSVNPPQGYHCHAVVTPSTHRGPQMRTGIPPAWQERFSC